MSTLSVFEIQKDLITPDLEIRLRDISKFYEVFNNKAIIILIESFISDVLLTTDLLETNKTDVDDIIIETYPLNMIARNRLINNFIKDRPDLSFILIGCDTDTRLIKIWRRSNEKIK